MEKSAALGHRAPTAAERWESAEHGDEQREREYKSERHPLANPRAWSIFFFLEGGEWEKKGKKKKPNKPEKKNPLQNETAPNTNVAHTAPC